MKKIILPSFVIIALFLGLFSFSPSASAETSKIDEINKQISELLAQIKQLKAQSGDRSTIEKLLPTPESTIDTTDTANPKVTVLYPNGGEVFNVSANSNKKTPVRITWSSVNFGKGQGEKVDIDLIDAAGNTVKSLAKERSNNGNFSWKIDSGLKSGLYRIMISTHDKGPTAQDFSDKEFTITRNGKAIKSDDTLKPSILVNPGVRVDEPKTPSVKPDYTVYPNIVVVSPNGGETLRVGEDYKIVWKGGKPNSMVRINLYGYVPHYGVINPVTGLRGMTSYYNLATVPNTGSYGLTIPDSIPEGRYFINVEWPSTVTDQHRMGPFVMDFSDKLVTVYNDGTAPSKITSDVNGDGKVNEDDYRIVKDSLGDCSATANNLYYFPQNYCRADVNFDDVVDQADLDLISTVTQNR